ncbi:MAG: ABC transporter permease subunit [Rhodospirillaceae bacterium]|nr:ABC transporter permease subunit [Rhodospirillaceae bacterium]
MTTFGLPWRALSLVAVLAAWEAAGRFGMSLSLPPFSEVVAALLRLADDGSLVAAIGETLRPVIVGTMLSLIVGVTLGLAMGLSRVTEAAFVGILICLDTAPMAALVPLIASIYGVGFAAKLAAVMLLAVPIVALNAYRGIHAVNPILLDMHRSFVGSRWRGIVTIMLPAASGMLAAGIRLGVAGAFVGAILAELLISTSGIGELIVFNRAIGKYAEMYAAIVAFVILAAGTLALLRMIERRMLPAERWAGAAVA